MSVATSQIVALLIDLATVAALVLSIWQLRHAASQSREAGRQSSELKLISESLKGISESLFTRYLGPIPDYLIHVVTLLEQAHQEILVVSNIPLGRKHFRLELIAGYLPMEYPETRT